MEHTIQKLAQLAGVSTRTLRYYDEIGLLEPVRKNDAGYRIYGRQEVDKLQHILFYRKLELDLATIKGIVNNPSFDGISALQEHRRQLINRRQQLNRLIENVEQTLSSVEGVIDMSDSEKFEGFKKEFIEDNERRHGQEAREKYGDDMIDRSNSKMLNMSETEYEAFMETEKRLNAKLLEAMETNDTLSAAAQETSALHKEWLGFTWPNYSKEAHAGLAQMYVDDPRFTAYYDKVKPGAAVFLRDAIYKWIGLQQ